MTPRRALKLIAPISTPRLVVEPLLGAHAEELFGILHDPRTQTWIPAPKAATVAELRESWTRGESRCDDDGLEARLAWAIRAKENCQLVGKIDANVADTRWATNVGYVLAPRVWGNGFATEAVFSVVDHLFALGIKGCHAYVMPGNDASCRVLLRAGFEPAGMLLDELKFTRKAVPDRAL